MKHFGKTIKLYHYIPLLDDRNINDQGIDATGSTATYQVTISIYDPSMVETVNSVNVPKKNAKGKHIVAENAVKATALSDAKTKATAFFKNLGIFTTSYATTKTNLTSAGWVIEDEDSSNNPVHCVPRAGNLYGSSRDVGTISGKLPVISETGGRVNRVGFTRVTLEASITNFGFFDEYTEDSVQFDNESDLMQHISRETLRAANYIYEDKLQMDLLNGANVVFYGGNATSTATLTGESSATTKSELTYGTLVKLEAILNDNRCPKDTKIISGSRMTDTRTIGACRYAYVGAELKTSLLKMVDFHNNPAFIPVQQYAEAGKVATGEIGSIGNFRFIENPDMLHWEAAGAAVSSNGGYLEGVDSSGNAKYNVYPMLVVGSGCFTTIGFQTDGDNTKFKILHKAPGVGMAGRDDPYGKIGFYSIQWWYGTLIKRPEWLALVKVVAQK